MRSFLKAIFSARKNMMKKHVSSIILTLSIFFFINEGNAGKSDPCITFCKPENCRISYFFGACQGDCQKKLPEMDFQACKKANNTAPKSEMTAKDFKACNKDTCQNPSIKRQCSAAIRYYVNTSNLQGNNRKEKEEDRLMSDCKKAK